VQNIRAADDFLVHKLVDTFVVLLRCYRGAIEVL
jgi:hypothetical protein